MYLEHRLSALLQLHLHSRLNIWLDWIGQRQLQGETRNIYVWRFCASYIRDFTVLTNLTWMINHHGHSMNVAIILILSIVEEKHFPAMILELLNTIPMIQIAHLLHNMLLYKLAVECLWRDRGGWELHGRHGAGTFVCPLNTGRGIGNETCKVDKCVSPHDLWLGSNTNMNCAVICNSYLDG